MNNIKFKYREAKLYKIIKKYITALTIFNLQCIKFMKKNNKLTNNNKYTQKLINVHAKKKLNKIMRKKLI